MLHIGRLCDQHFSPNGSWIIKVQNERLRSENSSYQKQSDEKDQTLQEIARRNNALSAEYKKRELEMAGLQTVNELIDQFKPRINMF